MTHWGRDLQRWLFSHPGQPLCAASRSAYRGSSVNVERKVLVQSKSPSCFATMICPEVSTSGMLSSSESSL